MFCTNYSFSSVEDNRGCRWKDRPVEIFRTFFNKIYLDSEGLFPASLRRNFKNQNLFSVISIEPSIDHLFLGR